MERLIQFSLVFLSVLCLTLTCSSAVYAKTSTPQNARLQSIDQQLRALKDLMDKNEAIIEIKRLLENKTLTKKQKLSALHTLAMSYFSLNNFELAIKTVKQAKGITVELNLDQQQADLDKLLGVFYHYQGDYALALVAYQASLTFYDTIKLPATHSINTLAEVSLKRANLLNNIALVQTSMHKVAQALQSYKMAEPIYQQYGDEIDKIDVRYNIATLYISIRRFDIALTMLNEIIKKKQQLGDSMGVAKATADMGVAYKYSGQYKLAKKYVLQALEYFKTINNDYEIAAQLHNLAEIHIELSQPKQAEIYARQGIITSQKADHQRSHAGSLQSLARAQIHQGKLVQASQSLILSNDIASKIGYQSLLNTNISLMALVHAGQNNNGKAIAALSKYEKAHNKLNNIKLNEQLAQFESDQLIQKVERLEQNKKLRQLQSGKAEQQRYFIFIGVFFILTVLFLFYRRYLESSLTNELEIRVKQRTQELQQANLIKNQFLANMSHEIRTPLTAVIGQAEAIINGYIDDENLNKEVEIIHGNSLHLLQLINDFLDLSKIEANKLELDLQQQDLQIIIQDLADMFTDQAQRKGLTFTIIHALSSPFIINVDGFRLKQILINLCSNAIKFTAKGKISLNISLSSNKLVFSVMDTGIGMSDVQIKQVFDSFSQADPSISRRFGGTGLGLFLSEQLVKVMNGKITVISEVNKGSTFTLTLPCELKNSENDSNNIPKKVSPPLNYNNALPLYSGQVLLAEDHHDNRRLIVRLLKSLGLEVIEASNGTEAIEQFLKTQPKLILLDIQMPEMDGIEAFSKLRALGCKQPIYALTANAMSHEIEQYLSLGFDGHLKKPLERKYFIAVIAKYYEVNASAISESLMSKSEMSENALEHTLEKPLENQAAIDKKLVLNANAALNKVELSDLVTEFTAKLTTDKKNIIDYQVSGDTENLAKASHRLAGAAQMFGFIEIAQSAAELESALKQHKTELVEDLTHCLLDEISLIEKLNQEKLNQKGPY
ncbi:MAG: ATP-binding protein [Colwellia sp.]